VILEESRDVAGRREDAKETALRAARALNPRPEAVLAAEFAGSEFLDARDLVQVKYEMVRRVHLSGDSVSGAATAFGFSRPSWYAAAAALEEEGLPGLLAARPGPRRAHKLTEEVLADVRAALAEDPSLRPAALVERIADRFGIRVHPRSLERALARADRSKSR
jgi:transposase